MRQPITEKILNVPLLFYKADLEKNENALIMVKEKAINAILMKKIVILI